MRIQFIEIHMAAPKERNILISISLLKLEIFLFFFLLFAIYIRRKYWISENFGHPVLDGFTFFEMS